MGSVYTLTQENDNGYRHARNYPESRWARNHWFWHRHNVFVMTGRRFYRTLIYVRCFKIMLIGICRDKTKHAWHQPNLKEILRDILSRLMLRCMIVGIETEIEGCMLWYNHDEQNLRGTEIKVSIPFIKYFADFAVLWCLVVLFWFWLMERASGVLHSDLHLKSK